MPSWNAIVIFHSGKLVRHRKTNIYRYLCTGADAGDPNCHLFLRYLLIVITGILVFWFLDKLSGHTSILVVIQITCKGLLRTCSETSAHTMAIPHFTLDRILPVVLPEDTESHTHFPTLCWVSASWCQIQMSRDYFFVHISVFNGCMKLNI
jgi:hypothetical protein